METPLPTEDSSIITYAHASGELFTAANLEAARSLCPVLGKMSLEEVGLLLELEAMGKEQLSHTTAHIPGEAPAVGKTEKAVVGHRESRETTKTALEPTVATSTPSERMTLEHNNDKSSELTELSLSGVLVQQLEATKLVQLTHEESAATSPTLPEAAPTIKSTPKLNHYNQILLIIKYAFSKPNGQ